MSALGLDALPGRASAAHRPQMREERLEAKSRANSRYDRRAACCNNMPCASNGPLRVYIGVYI